jgi:hexokinase
MTEKIKELVPEKFKFQLVLSEDGSGRGAALIAAVADSNDNKPNRTSKSSK